MKQTQKETILRSLQMGLTLIPLDALREFGCNRLAARICELRQEGHDIEADSVSVFNQFGGTVKVAQYRMVKGG